MSSRHYISRQRGTTTVEVAICAGVLLTMMFAVIEFGRMIFTLNVLNEETRRAARVAVVCPPGAAAITIAAKLANLPGTPPTVAVEYLDATGAVIANPAAGYSSIDSVRVRIYGYQMPLAIPFLNLTFSAPQFSSTLPRESLGVAYSGAAPAC